MDAATLAAAKAYANKRLNWRGAWAATTAYAVNDLVTFNGGLYRAPTAFTSGASFVAANWVELVAQSGTYVPVPSTMSFTDKSTLTRRACLLFGCPGDSTNATLTDSLTFRFPLKLSVTTTRWRVKVRNFNVKTNTTGTAIGIAGITFGQHVIGSLGIETGKAVGGALTSIVGSGNTMPGDGTYYTSPWVTASNLQIQRDVQHLLAIGVTGSASLPRGAGSQAWVFTSNVTTGLDGSLDPSGNPGAAAPFDLQIEYEYQGTNPCGVFVGDSITSGVGGDASLSNTRWKNWPALYMARMGGVSVNLGAGGTLSGDWKDGVTTPSLWNRLDWANMNIDFACLALGSNDANVSATLGTYQSNMQSAIAYLRSLLWSGIPIYIPTVTPRSLTTTPEAIRVSYNGWLRTKPLDAAGVWEFDHAVKDSTTASALATDWAYSDLTHFNLAGYNRLAQVPGTLRIR